MGMKEEGFMLKPLRYTVLLFAAALVLAGCPEEPPEDPLVEPPEEPTTTPEPTPPDDEPIEPIDEAHRDDRDSGDMPRDNEPADLVEIRGAAHDGFDRVVMEFEGPERPGWQVSSREESTHPETGEDLGVAGETFLFVEFHFAGFDGPERIEVDGNVVTEVAFAHDDAHGLIALYVGLAGDLPYATGFLEDPLRLVLDAVDDVDEPAPDVPTAVDVRDEQLTDQDGNVLLSIEELPDNVQPDPDTEFGGPTHFTDAVLSDDGTWIAIGSAGVAHSYGWLYDVAAGEHHFVAFQFEGSVTAHSWSPDDRFALFSIGTPAETGLLKVVDRDEVQPYAADTGFVVEVDAEEGMEPPFAYEVTEWQEPHTLCFELEGTPYCVDADTAWVEPAG
jgi:hypothetical protein